LIIIYGLLGLVAGGVINLLADALPRNRPIPPVRVLFRRPIKLRYLIVAAGTALVFAFLYAWPDFADPIKLVLASFHSSVLILIIVTDFEWRRIPNRAILPAIVIAAVTSPLWFYNYWYIALIGGAIGYGFFWLAAVVGGKLIGRGAMGGGDVKLAAFVGLITGFPGVITALVVTILVGGLISAGLLLLRVVNLRSGIPYGPFIALGGFVTMLWGAAITLGFFFK
jgi:leader peptidase (prepilin peptidase)/N-methyltransferase